MNSADEYRYVRSIKMRERLIMDSKISHFVDKTLNIVVYDNATILPYNHRISNLNGGVIREDGSFVEDSALHEEYYDGSYPYNKDMVQVSDKTAVYLGSWINIYGHAITDNIKKLWFLFTQECQTMLDTSEEYDFVYICLSEGNQPANYIRDILGTIGLNFNRFKVIKEITTYKRVIVPENSLILDKGVRYFTREFKDLVQRIKDNSKTLPVKIEKIYLTRSGIHDGKDFNEGIIEKGFAAKGYKVISPETLTFGEQVALMKGCRSLATTVGSVSHNAMFCEEGTKLILLNKADYLNGYQLAINRINIFDVLYIDAHHSLHNKVVWAGPFFLWKTPELCEYLGSTSKPYYLSFIWYWYFLHFHWINTLRPLLVKLVKPILKRITVR